MTNSSLWRVQQVWFPCYLLQLVHESDLCSAIWRHPLTLKCTETLISSMRLKMWIVKQMVIAAASSR